MPDSTLYQLLQRNLETSLAEDRRPGKITPTILWIADENSTDEFDFLLKYRENICVLTNRYDIAQSLHRYQIRCFFSDYDFSTIAPSVFDRIVYRISKERFVSHHVLNHCAQKLAENGQLIIAGRKNEGIKNYCDKLKSHLGFSGTLTKNKEFYSASLFAPNIGQDNVTPLTLEDGNYTCFRPTLDFTNFIIHSKPGIYGWNKLDKGSELLASLLPEVLESFELKPSSALDLGCGTGYLSLIASTLGIKTIIATDNNAAAINACKLNFQANNVSGEVIADDCGASIQNNVDLLVCNPPFHKGFSTDTKLTELFVNAARRLTRPRGKALFVVNAFIPIERIAKRHFQKQYTLANNTQYKVLLFN